VVACVPLEGARLQAILIPHGVAHGFYFSEPATHIYSVTHYWDPDDELGCHWSDPELGIPFPCANPRLSERDAGLPSLRELLNRLHGDGRP
jgi:dTDP-4-dehydrorhamnose 3,5-epimerase